MLNEGGQSRERQHMRVLSTLEAAFFELPFSAMQVCTCFLSSQGLKVTVEQSKCVQANAFIQASLFQQFVFRQEASLAFRINLTALIECLNIFGGSGGPECHTALKMCYAGYGSPLTLL